MNAHELERQAVPYQYVREPLRGEDADRLCAACKTAEEKMVVFTLLDTGLRVSELCAITPEDILWQRQAIRVRGKGGPFGSKSNLRTIPMTARVRALLEPYFTLHDRFPLRKRAVQNLVKRVAERARISKEVTPHVLRHTFAVITIQKGISLPALQRILGHDNLSTTQIYLNLSPEHVLEEFQAKW